MKAKFINENIEDVLKPKSENEIKKAISKYSSDELWDLYKETNNVEFLRNAVKKGGLKNVGEYELEHILNDAPELSEDVFPLIVKNFMHKLKKVGDTYKVYFGGWGVFADLFNENREISVETIQTILDGDAFEIFEHFGEKVDLENESYAISILSKKLKDTNIHQDLKKAIINELSRHPEIDQSDLKESDNLEKVFNFFLKNKSHLVYVAIALRDAINETESIAAENVAYKELVNKIKSVFGWNNQNPIYKDEYFSLPISNDNIIKMFNISHGIIDKISYYPPSYGWTGDIEDEPETFNDALLNQLSDINDKMSL